MGRIKDESFFQMVHDYLKIYLPNQMCASGNTVRAYRIALDQPELKKIFPFFGREKGDNKDRFYVAVLFFIPEIDSQKIVVIISTAMILLLARQ